MARLDIAEALRSELKTPFHKPLMSGVLLALFSVTAWSTNYVAGRYLALHGVDPIALSIARFAIATPVTFAVFRLPRYAGELKRLAVAGALGVAAFNLSLYASLQYMSAFAASLFVVLAGPLTASASYAARGRAPPPQVILGGSAALVGAYLALAPYISVKSLAGPLLAAIATASWSAYTIYVRRIYGAYRPGAASAWINLLGLADMAPAMPFARFDTLARWDVALPLLYVATVPGALAYAAWNAAVDRAGPAKTAAVLPLMPVMTLTISALLGEAPSPAQAVGMALTIAGVYLTARSSK